MIRLKVAMLFSTLGLALVACSHDRPANDASSANSEESTATGAGESTMGNSRPNDTATGTDLAPESSTPASGAPGPTSGGSSTTGSGPSSGSSTGTTGSGSTGH